MVPRQAFQHRCLWLGAQYGPTLFQISPAPILRKLLQKLPGHIFPMATEYLPSRGLSGPGIGHSFCYHFPVILLMRIILCFHLSLRIQRLPPSGSPQPSATLSSSLSSGESQDPAHFNPLGKSPDLVDIFRLPKVLTEKTDIFCCCYQRYHSAHLTQGAGSIVSARQLE